MFELTQNTFASRDLRGNISHIEHTREPFLLPSLQEPTPEQLADAYLAEVLPLYRIDTGLLVDLSSPVAAEPLSRGAQLHREQVKDIAGSIVVDYIQSYAGLPVWRADFAVHIASNPMRVTSSTSTLHDAITLGNDPNEVAEQHERILTPTAISQFLGLRGDLGVSRINGMKLVIYQYDPDQRTEPVAEEPEDNTTSFEHSLPILELPSVPDTFQSGVHYAVVEVLFDLALPEWEGIHWRALIEPISGTVLHVRPLVAYVTGRIFLMDPISLSGDATLTPAAPAASLDNLQTTVPLTDLISGNPQNLHGTQVDLQELELPTVAEPSTTNPFEFNYGTTTTDFAAVNAYYHVNWFFNLMKGMGFDLNTYFDHTTFPVPVDHWGLGGASTVNAHCPGNTTGNGIGRFAFASAQAGQIIGIANDVRIVIHEFGHGLLWDHVNSPNFGFAHSAGDALAAILMDPESIAPDRFLSFPWPQLETGPLDRRHDRQVSQGWGWFGSEYNTQYRGEQILSTTLFRLYRSVGGDSPNYADRVWAARYVSYLIIKAIGTLTNTTDDPEVFVTALMNADLTTSNFEGHPGGSLAKVIRWAFEKQGLFQPLARPNLGRPPFVTTEGAPPDVDVYIDDGRRGEYQYLHDFGESQDIWVRHLPDGSTAHQEPALGQPNYIYVKVKNRGSQTANNVIVKTFHCPISIDPIWFDDCLPIASPLSASESIPPRGETVIGPFESEIEENDCLLAIVSADGDPANDTTVLSAIQQSRFVPFDNNIGQRNIGQPNLRDIPLLQACASLLLLQSDRRVQANIPATAMIKHYAGAVQAGTTTYGAIELASPAPSEGKIIRFTSSDSMLIRIPNVTVPAGETTATFPIQIANNVANATVTLTATSDFTKQASLSIPARTTQTLLLGTKSGFNANVLGIAANGRYVYATHYYSNIENANESFGKGELVVIHSTTFKEVPNARIAVSYQPRSVAVNPFTNRLYVFNRGESNVEPDHQGSSLSIIEINQSDASKLKEITRVKLGIGLIDVAVNTQKNRIYVTDNLAKRIRVINGETNQELQSIQLPSRPAGITVDERTNTLYVAMLDRSVNPIVNTIAVVKITGETGDQTQTQIETIPIYEDPENPDPTRPTQPVDVAFNPDLNHLYVANLGGGGIHTCVTVINLATREATTVKTIAGARAITVNPQLNQVYIGTDAGVQIMDGVTNSIVSTSPQKVPWGVAVELTTGQIYAGSASEGTVTQLAAPDLSTLTQWT